MVLGAQCPLPKAEDGVIPALIPVTWGNTAPGWLAGVGECYSRPQFFATLKFQVWGWGGHCGPFPKSDE